MKFLRPIADFFSRWIDCVAATIVAMVDRFGSGRGVRLIEEVEDTFAVQVLGDGKKSDLPAERIRIANESIVGPLPPNLAAAMRGSRAELVLLPSRFLFRPLDLPKRAAEYLDGIVRAQIDRLTPWSANEAVYSWTPPTDATNDRIELTIAATARAKIAPYLRAISDLGAASVAVATLAPGAGANAPVIQVFEQRARSAMNVARLRSVLAAVFLLVGLAAVVSLGIDLVGASRLDDEQQELQRKITAIRTAMRGGQDRSGGTALHRLAQRKQARPSSVIVLEALSRALPDHTYVTEFRIDGDKVQVVGVTRDAPSLIELIEKSPNFAHATFFAPTTRTAGEQGERFHIEAHINPVFSFGT